MFLLISLCEAAESEPARIVSRKVGSDNFLLNTALLDDNFIHNSESDLEEQITPSAFDGNGSNRSSQFSDEWSNLSLNSVNSPSPTLQTLRQNIRSGRGRCPSFEPCVYCLCTIFSLTCAYLILALFLTIIMVFSGINLPDGLHF